MLVTTESRGWNERISTDGAVIFHPFVLLFVNSDRDFPGDTLFFHRDSIQTLSLTHRDSTVGNDEKLRLFGELLENSDKSTDIRLIQWRIDFVENAEWTRLRPEYCEQHRNCGKGLLAS